MLTKKQQLNHNKKPKRKRCKNKDCNKLFTPQREMQPCCCYSCEMNYALKNVDKLVEDGKKLRKKDNAKKKQEVKKDDKGGLKETAQKTVNKYIRLRDELEPCISCGKYEALQWDAGHFKNVHGHPQIRFYTLNIWKQCSYCNDQLRSNPAEYERSLIKKLGLKKVEEIKQNISVKKYSVEYLKRLTKVFRKKIRLYERKFR